MKRLFPKGGELMGLLQAASPRDVHPDTGTPQTTVPPIASEMSWLFWFLWISLSSLPVAPASPPHNTS